MLQYLVFYVQNWPIEIRCIKKYHNIGRIYLNVCFYLANVLNEYQWKLIYAKNWTLTEKCLVNMSWWMISFGHIHCCNFNAGLWQLCIGCATKVEAKNQESFKQFKIVSYYRLLVHDVQSHFLPPSKGNVIMVHKHSW